MDKPEDTRAPLAMLAPVLPDPDPYSPRVLSTVLASLPEMLAQHPQGRIHGALLVLAIAPDTAQLGSETTALSVTYCLDAWSNGGLQGLLAGIQEAGEECQARMHVINRTGEA